MKLVNGNLVITTVQFVKDNFKVDVDKKEVADVIRSLSFTETLKLADAIKTDDAVSVSSYFDIAEISEAGYGTIGTQQASSSSIKSQATKDVNAQRRANNAQQDANRDANVNDRSVPGNINKTQTGQPGMRYDQRADPDDVQRGQNSAQAATNAAEIARLKQLVQARR
jgi:hypothetical protein